jgi:hypothetical protein
MQHTIPEPFVQAIKIIHRLFAGLDCPWAFTGSLGMAIQGMQVQVHDIDIQTDQQGAYLIQDRLQAYGVREVGFSESARIRSHFGEFRIGKVKVEVMGDVEKRLPDGTWLAPPDLSRIVVGVPFAGRIVPAIDLPHEEIAYRILGRVERADQIAAFLRESRGAPGGSA